jgi:hypothetical protein
MMTPTWMKRVACDAADATAGEWTTPQTCPSPESLEVHERALRVATFTSPRHNSPMGRARQPNEPHTSPRKSTPGCTIGGGASNPREHVVNVPEGGLLIPASGETLTLNDPQVAVYFLRPKGDMTLLDATDDTTFVSDLPELGGYEFRCVPIRDDRNPSKVCYTYKLTRV